MLQDTIQPSNAAEQGRMSKWMGERGGRKCHATFVVIVVIVLHQSVSQGKCIYVVVGWMDGASDQ